MAMQGHLPLSILLGVKRMSTATATQSSPNLEIDFRQLDDIIENQFDNNKENLIMILQAIQKQCNYLPRPALNYLSTKIGIPYSQIYGVATFYATFSLEPRGRNIISICTGTACHVRGAERIREQVIESIHIKDGQTTPDGRFTLETVRCIGCCSLGPVVKINEDTHARLSTEEVEKVLDQYE
jgi:NADH:ubiquinone oxidoreductase subunit E